MDAKYEKALRQHIEWLCNYFHMCDLPKHTALEIRLESSGDFRTMPRVTLRVGHADYPSFELDECAGIDEAIERLKRGGE